MPSTPSPKLRKIGFIPDCHWPYADKRAWGVMVRAMRTLKPDTLVTLGDFGDFYCTSRHTKDPNRSRDLKTEVDACNDALDELDTLGVKDKRFILGNHEDNLERYLSERAPELYNLVRVEELFLLKGRGWKVIPYKDFDRIGRLVLTHDVGYAGRDAHLRSGSDVGANILIGHTHRLATGYSSDLLGKHRVAAMSGWLGDRHAAEYMYKAKTKDWALGFSVGYQETNGTVHVFPVPIVDYRCVLEGRIII